MNFHLIKRLLVLLVAIINSITFFACDEEILSQNQHDVSENSVDEIDQVTQELSHYDAILTVVTEFQPAPPATSATLQLQIGQGNAPRVHNLPALNSTSCTTTAGIMTCSTAFTYNGGSSSSPTSATQPEDDHPFVNHPDDWDSIALANQSNAALILKRFLVRLEVRDSTSNGGYIAYSFIDSDNLAMTIGANNLVRFDALIQERRECVFASAICGNTDMNACDPATTTCRFGSQLIYPTRSAIQYSDFPIAIQEAVKDIGQPGMTKFAPYDTSGNSNGCYGPPGYYLSNYSNNVTNYNCTRGNQVCNPASCTSSICAMFQCEDGTDNDSDGLTDNCGGSSGWCAFFVNDIDAVDHNCSLFKYYGEKGGQESLLWIDQFVASSKGAIVLFDEDIAGNPQDIVNGNSGSYVICRLDSNGQVMATQSNVYNGGVLVGKRWTCNFNQSYTPKSGDYFQIARGEEGGYNPAITGSGSHLMLWLDRTATLNHGAGGAHQFGGAILEKGNPLGARWRVSPIGPNVRFYFGETDIQTSFRAIQQSMNYLTVL